MEKAIHQTPPILLRQDRGVVSILTLNRPEKLNALSNELIYAIIRALDVIELDPTIRVVVITGAGRAFCAGADIVAFQRHMQAGPADAVTHFMRPGQQMTRRVESFPKPIIAAVNGLAVEGANWSKLPILRSRRRQLPSARPRLISESSLPSVAPSDYLAMSGGKLQLN
jgi:1,4-dihydroxy-2-naphthoyl-CoA synthase